MLIESDFFVGEQLRWNLGWASPNYAGAFVAMLLALGFGFSRSRWRWGFFVLELGGFFLLAKTYSRGALVAWGVAWLFGVISTGGLLKSREWWLWLGRIAALGVILYSVGVQWSRAENALSATAPVDRSVGNRLALWKGGLKMIAAAPLQGWGAGESGRAYQQWFQNLERDERFTTMVNSYLSVAVERGLPTLTVALFILWAPVLCAWGFARGGNLLAMAAGVSLVSWSVANGFSTLWIEWRLWIVPCLAYALLASVLGRAWRARRGPLQFKVLAGAGGFALVTALGLYLAGGVLGRNEGLGIYPTREGVVIASRHEDVAQWDVWPDAAVLGALGGKELRRWLTAEGLALRLVVHSGWGAGRAVPSESAKGVMLLGKQAARVSRFRLPASCEALYIIHPTVSPPDETAALPERVVVIFPEIDEVGNRVAWERWSEKQGAAFIGSRGSGLDARWVWTEVLSEATQGGLGR